jgi:oligopeptide transport system permease protein
VTVFIVITVVFLLMRLLPVEGYFEENYDKLDPDQRENILRSLGLLDPWYVQLRTFYSSLLRGDLGKSIVYRPKVEITTILASKVPYSVRFGLAALCVSLSLGLAMGVAQARNKGKLVDRLFTGYIVFINAVPAAVYLIFIQLYVSRNLGLPILFNAMWMRRYMVDELNKDYIRLARAKGMSGTAIMVKHVMRNAFVPMAQYLPASVLFTISGSIYIESLYSIPGMGGLLVDAIQRQDNTLVQALVLIFSSLGIIGLFLGDVAMAIFDPRIKLEKRGGSR